MAGRIILVTTLLVLLTSFPQDPPLHKTNAAARVAINAETNSLDSPIINFEPQPSSAIQAIPEEVGRAVGEPCYAFMRRRPAGQRAEAVQARLRHADRMTTAFDPNLLTVDILGDHANILSLEFPMVWPDRIAYVSRVSSVVDDYFSSPGIKDYLCESGFAEVRLSARGLNDEQSHLIWRAEVTTEGLVKLGRHPVPQTAPDALSLHSSDQAAMVLHK
jgi:hypothetical protein